MTIAKRTSPWAWFWVFLALIYFFVPLYATLDFSLRMRRGEISLQAYQRVFADQRFLEGFAFSAQMALLTIIVSIALLVPTAFWVHLKLPKARPLIEFITLLPFVIPAVVHVFGLLKTYSSLPLSASLSTLLFRVLLVGAYVILSFPYMYRAIDTGLRAIDVRTLTEAAQSLGAGWGTILWRVIMPNLRGALLGGAFLTFAIVMGELTLALYLFQPALGPYMWQIGQNRAYEPAALAIISLAMTWASIAVLQYVGRSRAPIGGGR